MTVYAGQLEAIVARLQAGAPKGARLLFAITSPMICQAQADHDVMWLNAQAAAIMQKHGVATVDLHAAVTGKCGAAPQVSCLGVAHCFCPHCSPVGYKWIADSTIAPAIKGQLGL